MPAGRPALNRSAHNPYAPPQAEVEHFPDTAADVWRDKKLLVMRPNADLPDRCIKCNAPGERVRQRSTVYAYHWAAIILILVLLIAFLPIGLLIALVLRKRAQVAYGLCRKHRRRRMTLGATAIAFMLLAVTVLFALGSGAALAESELLAGISISSFALALVLALIRGQGIRGKKITAQLWVLKGPHEPFLITLPKFQGDI